MGNALATLAVLCIAIGCSDPPVRPNEDANTDDATTIDTQPGTAQFGEPCSQHTDCADGVCVTPPGGDAGKCSRSCTNDCPTGWDCRSVEFPSGPIDACVPSSGRLCLACATDGECPGGGCLTLDGSGFCATSCASPADCPMGYECVIDGAGTHAGTYCQPVTSSCTCSAELAGVNRTCLSQNAVGTCYGEQTCTPPGGWSACTAATPSVETCDGNDNDCDFLIDDGLGGGACTNTNGFGSCGGILTCSGAAGVTCNGPTPMAEACNALDDNCNNSTDEGFPGLGNACMADVGACLRFGSIRCNGPGSGVECSAVAGTAITELCNQLDDDCDTRTDEAFTLGTQCSAGMGVCQRFGTQVCAPGGASTQCSAVAGPPTGGETCNYLDDDCNGAVDNGFRDVNGTYDTNTNCGACGINCATILGGLPNSSGGCAVIAMTAACDLSCSASFFDLDNTTTNGCEFQLDSGAIYVSANDPMATDGATCGLGPTGTGAGNFPCRSIAQGLARTVTTGRVRVVVADATYGEAVTLVSGKSLLGGYRSDTWERHLATTTTIIQGASPSGNHDRTVIASGITTATVLEGFVIRGSFNTKPSGNSYAVYVSGSNAMLTIRNNQIFGGRGGTGALGATGANGTLGVDGGPYVAASYDSFTATGTGVCAATNNRPAFGGGFHTCGFSVDNVSGGNGGGNNCTPILNSQTSSSLFPAQTGQAGEGPGGGAGGAVGQAGYDADWTGACVIPDLGMGLLLQAGFAGVSGSGGSHGGAVAGCAMAQGTVSGGHWVGGSGLAGGLGSNGGGGGGGGAGGGAEDAPKAHLGGHGGGGGSGGCGADGGGPGGAGGGVFGIFIAGGTAPTITTNDVTLGTGGDGGTGGLGGTGGTGGNGGPGGLIGPLACTGKGGRGGDGGSGGSGSGGGGGCGGGSYGIFTSGVGTPTYCTGNTVAGGAAGGSGGGGSSPGNPGGAGLPGVVSTCTSI